MQDHQADLLASQGKSLGHRRRPSNGKSMPVTNLVMNFPPPSEIKSYQSISRDGLTPENEEPIKYFIAIEDTDNTNSEYSTQGESYDVNESEVIGDLKHRPTGEDEYPQRDSPLDELCRKLCNSECKRSSPEEQTVGDVEHCGINIDKPAKQKLNMCSKINAQRRKFLTDLLVDSDDHEVVVVNKNDDTTSKSKFPNYPKEFREKFAIAEALAKTSMMTSPAAKRRIAARKIEMERDHYNSNSPGSDDEFEPPRELLLYLVRMGSFNSAPKINNTDSQDDTVDIPKGLTMNDLLQHCKIMRGEDRPQLLPRYFLKPADGSPVICNDITEGVRVLKLNNISKVCSNPVSSPKQIRILQWNILSQTLGQNNDGFVQCPDEALTWENRKYLILEEIVRNNPDVVCLQEVDHYKFLERMLGSQNYNGIFFPKPDSPCLYIEENNGPDGCAIFYKRDKFEVLDSHTRILEVWRVQSNQVAIALNLRIVETGKEICICTTHLKARNGALLSKLRNEQGKDLLNFLSDVSQGRPTVLSGDFNAEPIEPIYNTVLNYKEFEFASAYAEIAAKEKKADNTTESNGDYNCIPTDLSAKYEPPYTTWKIREEGEVCHTIDYVFYSKDKLKVLNCLSFPEGEEIGENRTPSLQYPSDHFSLVCDFELLD